MPWAEFDHRLQAGHAGRHLVSGIGKGAQAVLGADAGIQVVEAELPVGIIRRRIAMIEDRHRHRRQVVQPHAEMLQ